VFNFVAGYVRAIALGGVAAARRGRLGLAARAALMPLYRPAISYAALPRAVSARDRPYNWEKTEHTARLTL
jgi:hypothetical protein